VNVFTELESLNLFSPNSIKNNKRKITNMKFQPPKGTRDFLPKEMAKRREIFEKVAEARSMAIGAKTVSDAAKANNQLTETLKTLFAVAENYPQLKANENFLRLQEELSATENKIAFARQFYNDIVMSYNIAIQRFPSSIIAGIFKFNAEDFYSIPETEKEPVKVKF
jgi:LemA protein